MDDLTAGAEGISGESLDLSPGDPGWESPFRTSPEVWANALVRFGLDPAKPEKVQRTVKPRASRQGASGRARAPVSEDGAILTAWVFALRELGRLGAYLGDGRYALWCIGDAQHSAPDGSAENARGSCVLLPPLEDAPHGLPHCSHAHCQGLRIDDWRAIVPSDVWDRACEAARGEPAEVDPTEPAEAPAPPAPPAPETGHGASPAPDARPRIVVSRRTVTRDDNGGVAGALVERTSVPDLARAGLDAVGLTPWGDRIFTIEGSNPPTLVHVLPPGMADDGSPDSAPRARVVTTSKHILRGWLSGAARWVNDGAGRSGREVHEADPPEPVVSYALEACEGMRPLRGVVEAPVMRADGSVISEPGYDPATRLYASFDAEAAGEALSSVPTHPTAEDAGRAAASILALVCDFPFESEAHKVMWLAGVITMLSREAFSGPAPLFFARANTQGSGKSLLAELAHIIATGERPAMLGWSGNDEEFEKLVTAEALAGSSCVVIDNVTGMMRSACLDRILTSGKHRARILGGNTRFDGAMRAVWWASGNNVETSSDMGRRIGPIELVAQEERPDQRQGFAADEDSEHGGDTGSDALRKKCKRERWHHVAAVLTILRAWHCAGRPSKGPDGRLPAWGSFESWSRVVRGALVHAGCVDPGLAREEFRDSAATDAGQLRGLLAGWHEAVRARVLSPDGETLARAVKKLVAADPAERGGDELREALEAVAGESLDRWKGDVMGRVGKFLRSNRRKVARTPHGSMMFDVAGESGGSVRWKVLVTSAAGGIRGDKGDRGDTSSPFMARTQARAPAQVVSSPWSEGDHPPYPPYPPSRPSPDAPKPDADWIDDPPDFDFDDPSGEGAPDLGGHTAGALDREGGHA